MLYPIELWALFQDKASPNHAVEGGWRQTNLIFNPEQDRLSLVPGKSHPRQETQVPAREFITNPLHYEMAGYRDIIGTGEHGSRRGGLLSS